MNDDDSQPSSSINLMMSNKPIRILKRPSSQSQLLSNNTVINSSAAAASTSTPSVNNGNPTSTDSTLSNDSSSSTTVPPITIIPRNYSKDSSNALISTTIPSFVNTPATSQSSKPPIKTYEQREQEYRLARLR